MVPIPLLARPSVHIITLDPAFPYDAIDTELSKAGPRVVHPKLVKS